MRYEQARPVSDAEKAFKTSALFFGAHCVLAVALVLLAPAEAGLLPSFFRSWGAMLEIVAPSIYYLAALTAFPTQAWFATVVMWTLVPVSAVMAARLRYFWIPDETRFRRQPWLLLFGVALFGFITVFAMRYSPTDTEGYSRAARHLRLMASGPVPYGVYLGIAMGAVSMCIGFTARIIPLARRVLHDDFKNMRA